MSTKGSSNNVRKKVVGIPPLISHNGNVCGGYTVRGNCHFELSIDQIKCPALKPCHGRV